MFAKVAERVGWARVLFNGLIMKNLRLAVNKLALRLVRVYRLPLTVNRG